MSLSIPASYWRNMYINPAQLLYIQLVPFLVFRQEIGSSLCMRFAKSLVAVQACTIPLGRILEYGQYFGVDSYSQQVMSVLCFFFFFFLKKFF